jgi:hypothetical protein
MPPRAKAGCRPNFPPKDNMMDMKYTLLYSTPSPIKPFTRGLTLTRECREVYVYLANASKGWDSSTPGSST